MRRFTRLFHDLDASTRTTDKVAALAAYFREAPPEDAAWALRFLSGRRPGRAVSGRLLLAWVAARAELPDWLVEECHHRVGDLAETVALLLPQPPPQAALSLHQLVEERLLPLASLPEPERRARIERSWDELDTRERLVYHKLITGEFRLGVARPLVARALAEIAKLPAAVMTHRLIGAWEPTAAGFRNLLAPDVGHTVDPGRPYPFCLAHPLAVDPTSLGPLAEWQAEWKWDGVRAQVIRRAGDVAIWSRGEDLVTDQFPDVAASVRDLPDGTVLDGEILAWGSERPQPFAALQRRLGRKRVSVKLQQQVPLLFMAYDLLEIGGVDLREHPLGERRGRLEALLSGQDPLRVRVSQVINAPDWPTLAQERERARDLAVEGLMLKRRTSAYRVGRVVGDWWKWKVDPFHLDAVLVYAQYGHGRRSGLYTDYTFAVWDGATLVPVAKAYSGLTQDEIAEVDRYVRTHGTGKFGPVRQVEPTLVFELAFEGIQASSRHKSGIAVRFPRIARWRHDKPAAEADTLDALRALLATQEAAVCGGASSVKPKLDAG